MTDDLAPQVKGSGSRRSALIRLALVGAYLFVVFGILLPAVVDYEDMVAAFASAAPQALALVAVIGFGSWLLEGLAIRALMPGLGVIRSVISWLIMAATGNTIPGPVNLAIVYALFRRWGISPALAALGLTLNSLLAQVGKLLLPALAIFALTFGGTIPTWGFLAAVLISLPVLLGALVAGWVLRSEAFARRVGALATRATDRVMRTIRRPEPGDLTGRLLDFRDSARALLVARWFPAVTTQVLVRAAWGVCLLASLRAVGISDEVIPANIVFAVYAAVVAITVIPIAPGGAGLPELLYILFFTNYVDNPAYDDAIAAGVMLMRGFQWFLPIPVGYIALLVQRRATRNMKPVDDLLGGDEDDADVEPDVAAAGDEPGEASGKAEEPPASVTA